MLGWALPTKHLEVFATAAIERPTLVDLVENPVTEHVPGPGEGERGMSVQALEALRRARATDPEVERRARILPTPGACELSSNATLLIGRPHERGAEVGVLRNASAPALYAARQPRRGRSQRRGAGR